MYALQNALDECTRSQGNKNTRQLRHIFIRSSCDEVLKQETLVHCEGKHRQLQRQDTTRVHSLLSRLKEKESGYF